MDLENSVLRGAKILVVDDQPANLAVLRGVLEAADYKIFLAPSGKVALKSAARALPDLILLDLMMPEMDGFEVCRRLKANPETRHIPVIFITAEDQTQSVVEGFQVGAVDYIPKPFRDQEVLVRVRNAVFTKKLFEENRAHQQKLEKELETAREMQLGLMPTEAPRLDRVHLLGRCVPAEKVGGDFFRYFDLSDGGLALSIADVTGHAMAAAIPAVMFNGLLESNMEWGISMEELFARLNQSVHRLLDRRTYVCFVMARLDPERRLLRLANAGCPFPLHYRARTGDVVELVTDQAYPLGVSVDSCYTTQEITLEPGDSVAFCSDGISEAADATGVLYGIERIAQQRSQALAGKHAGALRRLAPHAQGAAATRRHAGPVGLENLRRIPGSTRFCRGRDLLQRGLDHSGDR